MHITLRPGEKFFVNGAVLRADRKVSLELMNDASFLLEAHIMNVDKATTPLRQLYFMVQTMLMNPKDTSAARTLFAGSMARMLATYDDREVLDAMAKTSVLIEGSRYFEALKVLRGAFHRDDALMRSSAGELALAG